MDSEPEQAATPNALDRVAAALAALGQDTAAAIAEQAGVGYSTATKRLRLLEEAGQAETFRADDGRTLWRQPTNLSGRGDSGGLTASTTDTEHPGPANPDGFPAPLEQGADTAVGAGPGDEPTGQPSPTPHAGMGQPSPSATPAQANTGHREQTATDTDGTPADADDEGSAETVDGAEPRHTPDPAGSDDSGVANGPAEAAAASAGGKPRRSNGTCQGVEASGS